MKFHPVSFALGSSLWRYWEPGFWQWRRDSAQLLIILQQQLPRRGLHTGSVRLRVGGKGGFNLCWFAAFHSAAFLLALLKMVRWGSTPGRGWRLGESVPPSSLLTPPPSYTAHYQTHSFFPALWGREGTRNGWGVSGQRSTWTWLGESGDLFPHLSWGAANICIGWKSIRVLFFIVNRAMILNFPV